MQTKLWMRMVKTRKMRCQWTSRRKNENGYCVIDDS